MVKQGLSYKYLIVSTKIFALKWGKNYDSGIFIKFKGKSIKTRKCK